MTSSLSKIPDLNNISRSTSVQERGLVHRGRNREEERSSLLISSWFRLLSVHEGQGKMGVGEDQKTCISIPVPGTTMGCFLQAISHLFLQTVPSISPSTQSTLSEQGYASHCAFVLIINIGYDVYKASINASYL